MTRQRALAAWLLTTCVTACAGPVRFVDRPIVWAVDDARHVDQTPAERVYRPSLYMADRFAFERSVRALQLRDQEPSLSTNALDEVPDSTWFVNRIGRREVSPAEAARGPVDGHPPQLPLTVISGKSGGGNPGFVAEDARGRRYIIKFDTKENPEMQTATDAIVSRLFWAAGYHVPADYVFVFDRSEVELGEGAKTKDALGKKRPMTVADIDEALAQSPKLADGRYRALASQFLTGRPIGGIAPTGRRSDDPNDTIEHERRRELRGMIALASWTNHTDMKEDNTLDMFVEVDGRKFVRHYFLDFGEAFASHAAEKGRYEDGFEHLWDWQAQPLALISFGLWKRSWEDLEDTQWPAIGAFEAKIFEPDGYRSAYPWWPFMAADRADRYWGAKIVMRFTREIIEAVVAEGRITNPNAARYLVETLVSRRDQVGRAWVDGVTALDDFTISGAQLCGIDLAMRYGLASTGKVEVLDSAGEVVETVAIAPDGQVCIAVPSGPAGYHVLRLRTVRGDARRPPMQVHLRNDGPPRLLGILRVEDES